MDEKLVLADELRAARGAIHFVQDQSTKTLEKDTLRLLDTFVEKCGLTGIGRQWKEVDRSVAVQHLTRVLHKDLAYDVLLMPIERAAALAERFVNLFGDARFFTNTIPAEQLDDRQWAGPPGWIPLTDATFDSGIVALGATEIGIVWVEDED